MNTWRGIKALVHDTVDATVELVREGHVSTSRSINRVAKEAGGLGEVVQKVENVRLRATSGVLDGVRLVNRTVETVTDFGLDAVQAQQDDVKESSKSPIALSADAKGTAPWLADAAVGLLNVAVGDYLDHADNALAVPMQCRWQDQYLSLDVETFNRCFSDSTGHLALFVHGAGTTEWSWSFGSDVYYQDPEVNFGSMLANDFHVTPLFLRYNTGRHVSDNGQQLNTMIQQIVDLFPVEVRSISLFGHSMGGLVVRSACLHGERASLPWIPLVKRAFYLGSPQQGAPLAKLGHALTRTLSAVDLPATRIISKVLDGRSDGLKDLRFGALEEEDWFADLPRARDELPMAHAQHVFISATVTKHPLHPVGQIIGDLLVRVPSASGPDPEMHHFPIETYHHGGVLHHQLQTHPSVYAQIATICRDAYETWATD